ncbi:hypothetical protein GCM10027417_00860 [Glutamicibacter endophyticus]
MNAVSRIVTMLVSLGAGALATKLVDRTWKGFTGNDAPRGKDAQAEATMRQAISFAVFSAAVAAVIQVIADRGANKALSKLTKK